MMMAETTRHNGWMQMTLRSRVARSHGVAGFIFCFALFVYVDRWSPGKNALCRRLLELTGSQATGTAGIEEEHAGGKSSLRGSSQEGSPAKTLQQSQDTSDAASAETSSSSVKRFIWLSDPHSDPYYGTEAAECTQTEPAEQVKNVFGTMGCDPPFALFESALTAVSELAGDYEFVLDTGDFVRHGQSELPIPREAVTSIIRRGSQLLVSTLGENLTAKQFAVGTLGNDDSPMNYYLDDTTDKDSNPWLSAVASAFVESGAMPADVEQFYSYGGYWERQLGSITILSINTIIYAALHVPATAAPDPFHQFAWLRERLHAASAENRSVWIVGHIPPGIETFGYSGLWHPTYVDSYLELVQDKQLSGTIVAQLFGHVHKEEIRILPDAPSDTGPMILTGSISPIFRNQPSFRVFEYDAKTGRPLTWKTYYAELTEGSSPLMWKLGYDAADLYNPIKDALEANKSINQGTLGQLADLLAQGGSTWNSYASWYTTSYENDLQHCGENPLLPGLNAGVRMRCVRKYVCALTVSTETAFADCVNNSGAVFTTTGQKPPTSMEDFANRRKDHWRDIGIPEHLLWPAGGFAFH